MVYAEGNPEERYPSERFDNVPVCPWLWYTP